MGVTSASAATMPWLGRSMLRREDDRFTSGRGTYVDDLQPDGCLHLAFARSPHAHGRIVAIDCEAARATDGVVAVFTARDLGRLGRNAINPIIADLVEAPFEVLATECVGALGQPVAAVVAETAAIARDAALLIDIDVDALPPAHGTAGNRSVEQALTAGDADAAFASADHVVAVRIEHALVAPTPMEPRAALAVWGEDGLTAWCSTQTPYRVREDLCRILGLPLDRVRVIAPDVGGAFGGKASIYPEDVMVAFAARAIGAAVKWCATRGEDLLAATQGRGATSTGEMAFSADGQALALRARLAFQQGHWMTYSAVVPPNNALRILPGPYRIGALDVSARSHMTNRAAVGIYRGAGRPEAAMLLDRLMDEGARATGIDPIALRLRNVAPADSMPLARLTGEGVDSGDFVRLLETLHARADYAHLCAERDRRRAAGEVIGIGICLYIEPCGQGWESAAVTLRPDGTFRATTGSSAQGQGRETSFAQIVADALGTTPEQVTVRQGDTSEAASGLGALASRSTAIGGSAMLRACEGLRKQLAKAAAELLQCAAEAIRFQPGRLYGGQTGASIALADLARQLHEQGETGEAALTFSTVYHAEGEAWASGACLAAVAIDRDTGAIRIERLVWIDDAGVVVNPLLARGQMLGGLAQGLGEAMLERLVYDDDGQLLTGSLMDYALPRADDMPPVEIDKIVTRSPSNALGAKGIGEAGCIGVPAAIFNAVCDAVAPFGPNDLQMPLTSEKVWRAIAGRPTNARGADDQ